MKNHQILMQIVIGAISAAIYIVLEKFLTINIDPLKITIAALPLIIVALLYGPVTGMITALVATFISQVIGYGITPLTIVWLIPGVVRALLVGILGLKVKKRIWLCIGIALSSVLVTILNTAVMALDSIVYNYYSYAYIFGSLVWRFVAGIISGVFYAIICPIVVTQLKKIKN